MFVRELDTLVDEASGCTRACIVHDVRSCQQIFELWHDARAPCGEENFVDPRALPKMPYHRGGTSVMLGELDNHDWRTFLARPYLQCEASRYEGAIAGKTILLTGAGLGLEANEGARNWLRQVFCSYPLAADLPRGTTK